MSATLTERGDFMYTGTFKNRLFVFITIIVILLTAGNELIAVSTQKTKDVLQIKEAKEIIYPLNMFDNGKARHFEYKTDDGVRIKYFIIKSSDGLIRAAFDACTVCWQEGKGYVQKDDFMVCRNCGRRFPSTKINVITGGCNPIPLSKRVEGNHVIITPGSLLQGKQFFQFARR